MNHIHVIGRTILGLGLIITCCSLVAMDNFHSYRAPFFGAWFKEPRIVEPHLSSIDVLMGYGSTCESRNTCCNGKTCLLSMCGPHNMLKLGSNVPCKNPSNIEDIALIQLDRTVGQDSFGTLNYQGKFKLLEAQIILTQNLRHGLYTQIALPIRHMKLQNVCYVDLSSSDKCCSTGCPNTHSRIWQNFLTLYDAILRRYDLEACGFNKTGIGDLSWTVGWACNYQDTRVLDYVDMDAQIGMMFPTSKKKNIDSAFDIPLGNNGHFGYGGSVNFSIGAYDWLTFGGHGGAIALLDETYCTRMKTDIRQNGYIKLAKGCATVDKGTIWDAGAFGKLDHIIGGFSLLAGYSYCAQKRDTLQPEKTSIFDPNAANCDCTLNGWDMHTIHLSADYDFAQEGCIYSPRIGLLANIIIGGENIFNTSMTGGSLGLDISFEY